MRILARQTESGRVEVRAQSSTAGNDWQSHIPEARFLPIEPETGRWYSSSAIVVSAEEPAPEASDPAAYTKHFVERAIDRYQRDGLQATLAYYNSPESIDGQWYIFIIDEDDTIVAHENEAQIGVAGVDVTGPDGYPAGRMVLAAAVEGGAWVDYQFNNPVLGRAQIKHSWVVKHDGLIFGSGWYEDAPSPEPAPGAYAQSLVERALEMHRVLGREPTLAYYDSPDSADGEWYVFIIAADGTRHAHPNLPAGANILDGGPDISGYNFRADIVAIEDRGWVSYVFENPETGEQGRKHTWIVRRDDLLFAAGWYESGS